MKQEKGVYMSILIADKSYLDAQKVDLYFSLSLKNWQIVYG